MNIAFIGLGNMGAPMAINLVNAGHDVTVFDLVESAMQALEAEGARSAAGRRSGGPPGAEVVISMLPGRRRTSRASTWAARVPAGRMRALDGPAADRRLPRPSRRRMPAR